MKAFLLIIGKKILKGQNSKYRKKALYTAKAHYSDTHYGKISLS